MLNEVLLGTILQKSLPKINVTDIHWKTQDSTTASILFYRIGSLENDEALFKERIKSAKFGILILNRAPKEQITNSVIVPEDMWPSIQTKILDILFPLPKLKLLAITGTNGKTTTTDLVLQIGTQLGLRGLSIGTLGVRENDHTILDFGLTSPPLIDLRKYLNRYGADKDFCVVEASSHALVQERLHGLKFDGAGWLSFSQDHLDYHQSMENYFAAKVLLIKELKPSAKIFIPHSQEEIFKKLSTLTSQCEKAKSVEGELPLFFAPPFNRDNLSVAWAIMKDVFGNNAELDFSKFKSPEGRFFIKALGSNYVVVDFAHTPDALDNICRGITQSFPKHKLKVLFGCGGDRDKSKRPKMGQVAEKWATDIYLTSDNPRSEEPTSIMEDILQGIHKLKPQLEVDRRIAVKKALAELAENEILLLAGKGHEDYILIKGVKYPYSDIQEVEDFVLRNKT